MKKPMREHGYPSTEFAAVLAASAAMADSVPPSVAMLILGSVTTLSVGALFLAGFLPAAILAIALLIAVAIRSRIKGFPQGPAFRPAARAAQHSTRPAGARIPDHRHRRPRRRRRLADRVGVVRRGLRRGRGGVRPPLVRTAISPGRRCAMRRSSPAMVLVMLGTSHLLVQAIVIGRARTHAGGGIRRVQHADRVPVVSVLALVVIGFVLEGFPAILVTGPSCCRWPSAWAWIRCISACCCSWRSESAS